MAAKRGYGLSMHRPCSSPTAVLRGRGGRSLDLRICDAASGSRQQLEGVRMRGPDDSEVPVVEGGDVDDPAAFGSGDDGRVNTAERQVVVLGHELGDPDQVGGVDGLQREVARCEVAKEPDFGLPAKSCGEQGDNFGDDESRYDERTGIGFQQFPARRMVGIVAVDLRVERARVDDQRDWLVSAAMISSIRSEMSVRPL